MPGLSLGLGLGLSQGEAAFLEPSQRAIPWLAIQGDSIVAGNNLATASETIKTQAIGEVAHAHALWPYFEWDSWGVTLSPNNFEGLNLGYSGDTAAQCLAKTNGFLFLRPDVVLVSVGTNTLNSITEAYTQGQIDDLVAACAADIIAICNKWLARGSKVILATIRPRNFSGDGAKRKAAVPAVNVLIEAYAGSAEGVFLWDVYSAYDDGSNVPKTNWLSDGLHPAPTGASEAARTLVPVLQEAFGDLSLKLWPDGTTLMTNGTMSGTSGVAGTGCSGSLGTGWVFQRVGTSATGLIVGVKEGAVQAFDITVNGAGIQGESLFMTQTLGSTAGTTAPTVDKWYRYAFELELDEWEGWRNVRLPSSQNSRLMDATGTAHVLDATGGRRMTVVSMPHKVPAGSTTFSFPVIIDYDGTKTGTGRFRFLNAAMCEVPDPRPLHGF